jgi:hypothetical protein
MSESAFNFKGAPSSNLGRQFVAWGGLKKAFGSKSGGSGISAKDQSALMRQQTAHNIDTSIVKHVLGETAADAAHQRTLADREHAVNQIHGSTPEGHVASSMSFPGGSARYSKVKQPKQDSTFIQPSSPSVDLTDIGSGPKGPQWRAR